MRVFLWLLVCSVFCTCAFSCRHEEKAPEAVPEEEVPEAVAAEGPSVGSEEPPLLLEEPEGSDDRPETTGPVADNSRCHVCHINYASEELAVTHAAGNVGCEDCHGSSDAHCSDEDNITPPDRMYAKSAINPACLSCHEEVNDDPDLRENHEEVLAGTAATDKYCTDCHGEHRLTYRTRRWNKETGELVKDDEVRMLTDDLLKEEEK